MSTSKRPSKAEIRRRIRQRRQPAPPAPDLQPDIAEYVSGYTPRSIDDTRWAKVRPFVIDALARYEPTALESARQRLVALVSYADWAVDKGYDLTRATLLDHELIDAFTDTADLAKTSATNYRSRLRGITNKVNPAGSGSSVSVTVAHRSVKPPYSETEQHALVRIARTQPNETTGRQMRASVGFGLGAGLDSVDVKRLYRRDVDDRGQEGIRIDVPGRRSRTVWVLRRYEDLVRTGLQDVRPGSLVVGKSEGRRNVCSAVYARAVILGDAPEFQQSRMRTTWLATLLRNRVPLPVIMRAAGLTSARTLTDLVPHIDIETEVDDLRGDV